VPLSTSNYNVRTCMQVSKEAVRAQYDGSIWEKIANDIERKRKSTSMPRRAYEEVRSDAKLASDKLRKST